MIQRFDDRLNSGLLIVPEKFKYPKFIWTYCNQKV